MNWSLEVDFEIKLHPMSSPIVKFCYNWVKSGIDNKSNLSQPQPWAHDQGKGLQGFEPRVSPGVTFHAPGSVRECEEMNLHTLK